LLPTGGKAWDALSATYNKWAKNRNFPERKRASLQNHWNKILNQAKDKPTGTGERKQLYFDALAAEKGISGKVSLGDIQDDDDGNNDSDDDEDIMDISSESEHDNDSKAVKKKGKKQVETVLTKAYKMEAPLRLPSRKTQSANFLDKLSISLDPQALQQRDENRTAASFQLLMLQNYQTQVATLTSQVNEERRRADDAEAELRMYRMLDRTRHRSPSRRYHRRSSYSRSHSPERSYRGRHHIQSPSPEHGFHGHSQHPPIRPPYTSYTMHSPMRSRHSRHAHSTPPSIRRYRYSERSRSPYRRSPRVATNSIVEDEFRSFDGDSAPLSPLLPQPIANRPTIASSSAVNLNDLASIAAGLPNAVAPGNTLSIRADNEGYFNVQNDSM
ncbi:hypothetical protein F5051DRAFT_446069, partial [Lentinula edodes]